MAVTLVDLQQRLRERYSPDDIVELLDITSEDLTDRFLEHIEERFDYLVKELDMEEQEDDNEDQT